MAAQQASDPNALNKAGDPIIFDAIENTDLEKVRHLIEAGADIEKQGFGNQTPALVAASANQWDICLYLLNQGADPTVADHSGITIPYLAFNSKTLPTSYQGQYLAIVKDYLIKRNLDALNIPPKQVRELKAVNAWPSKVMPRR
jgi:ankyrin repeat protein